MTALRSQGLCKMGAEAIVTTAKPATHAMTPLQTLKWEIVNHPAYNPYLAPSDFDLFGPLKEALRGRRRFVSYDKVHEAVHDCLRTQPKICYFDAFKKACRLTGKMQWEAERQCSEICNVWKIYKDMWGRKRVETFWRSLVL